MKGMLVGVNGSYIDVPKIDISVAISKDAAVRKAIEHIGAQKYIWEDEQQVEWMRTNLENAPKSLYPDPETVICLNHFTPEDTAFYMAYKVDIRAVEPFSHHFVYVDAKSGKILNKVSRIQHVNGTAETRYSGTRDISIEGFDCGLLGISCDYRLVDIAGTRWIKTIDMRRSSTITINSPMFGGVDFVNNSYSLSPKHWSSFSTPYTYQSGALDVHWGAMVTWDYFKAVHNRNSFNNQGAILNNLMNLEIAHLNSAAWDTFIKCIKFGSTLDTSLDIVAHEFGHGVNQFSANVATGSGVVGLEPYAILEGLSDIWAVCVQHYANNRFSNLGKNKWMILDEVDNCYRDLQNPKNHWDKNCRYPDTYNKGPYWMNNDVEGHNNGVVLGHWFFILSDGKTGTNDNGHSYNVTGITIGKAEKIVYRAQTVYMTKNTDFTNARYCTIQAAKDLYGAGSNEEIAVTNAWYAVGVGSCYVYPISGPSLVPCNSNVTYTIPSSASNITWSVSNLIIVSGQNTNTLTVKNDPNKTVQTAHVSVSCKFCNGGSSASISKTVEVGVPRITSITASPSGSSISVGTAVSYNANPANISTTQGNYEWFVQPASGYYQSIYRYNNYITYTSAGYYTIGVRSYAKTSEGHACNISPNPNYTNTFVVVTQKSPSSQFTVNMSNKDATVMFDPDLSATRSSFTWRLFYSTSGVQAAYGQIASTGGVLNFSHLPVGVYILQIDTGNVPPETHKIVLE